MTREEFDVLVSRLDDVARRKPHGYRRRVLLLALLGNVYIGTMLLLIVALLLVLLASVLVLKALAVKLILVVGVLLWILLKALWVSVPPPEGTEIVAGDAPELFEMIDALRSKLRAPRFHKILITDDFNAGVVQAPRLGVFGWYRNYLLIGLPLMKWLTEEQFKAVLAHEFGHLARGHGRVSNWIYRQRLRWNRLISALEQSESKGGFLFKPFLNWYAPYFNAYSFPLARANEYQADATAVSLTSPTAAAQALTNVNVVGSYLDQRYWPGIHHQADELPQPGFTPYAGMGRRGADEFDTTSTSEWLEQSLARSTTSDDTHPALSDRLKAIGASPHLAPPEPGQAADRLLGLALERITDIYDRRWRESIQSSWEERHREVQEDRRRLAQLQAQFDSSAELTLQEAYDRASLTESTGKDADNPFQQFRELHERAPDDAVICFSLGIRRLAREDDTGCALIERAMSIDEDFIVRGAETLRDYHWQHRREDQARAWHARATERSAAEEASHKERNEALLSDKFDRHDLSDEALSDLRTQLQAVEPALRKVYFVKKRVKHFPERPCYLLGYTVSHLFSLNRKRRAAEALAHIRDEIRFPGETLIISVEGENYRFGRKFHWMRGARIL